MPLMISPLPLTPEMHCSVYHTLPIPKPIFTMQYFLGFCPISIYTHIYHSSPLMTTFTDFAWHRPVLRNTILKWTRPYHQPSPLTKLASQSEYWCTFPLFPSPLKTNIPIKTIQIPSVEVDLLTLVSFTNNKLPNSSNLILFISEFSFPLPFYNFYN